MQLFIDINNFDVKFITIKPDSTEGIFIALIANNPMYNKIILDILI